MKHTKSIIQLDWDHCFFPNCPNEPTQVHHVLHGPNREKADEDGLVIHVCASCHDAIHFGKEGGPMDRSLKRLAQIKWEENEKSRRVKNVTLRSVKEVETYIDSVEKEIRADWMKRYGRNYR